MYKYSTVMIIDDNEIDNFLNKTILETMLYAEKIITYTNPNEALTYLNESINQLAINNIPDIIFLDINMPVMNGFSFLKEFNKMPENLMSKVKFYIISSSEDPTDINKIKEYSNIINYLQKPLNKNQLI